MEAGHTSNACSKQGLHAEDRSQKFLDARLDLVPTDGSAIGNLKLRQTLGEKHRREVDEATYAAARDALVEAGLLVKGQGRGGSVRRIASAPTPPPLSVSRGHPGAAAPRKATAKRATAAVATGSRAEVLSYRHGDRRRNNPDVGMVDPDTDPVQPKTRCVRGSRA